MRKTNLTSLVVALAIASSLTLTGCGGGGGETSTPPANNTEDTSGDTNTDNELTTYVYASEKEEYKDKVIDPYPNAPAVSQEQIEVYLQAVNEQRVKGADCHTYGKFDAVEPLVWNDSLYMSAQEHNYDMINAKEVVGVDEDLGDDGFIGHGGSGTETDWTATMWGLNDRSDPFQRIYNNGYDFISGAENIALYSKNYVSEQPTELEVARQAVKGWMESDGHCSAIMMSEDDIQGEMGMGYLQNHRESYLWTYLIGFR